MQFSQTKYKVHRHIISLISDLTSGLSLATRAESAHNEQKVEQNQEWVKVSVGELSVFYSKKEQARFLRRKVHYRFRELPTISKLQKLGAAISVFSLCLFCFYIFRSTESLSSNLAGKEAASSSRISQSDNSSKIQSAKANSSPLSQTKESRKIVSEFTASHKKRAVRKESIKDNSSLDPFRCAPARDSRRLSNRTISRPIVKGEFWYVCR